MVRLGPDVLGPPPPAPEPAIHLGPVTCTGEGGLELLRSGWCLYSRSSQLPGGRREGWALTAEEPCVRRLSRGGKGCWRLMAEVPRGSGPQASCMGLPGGASLQTLEDTACFQAAGFLVM